MSSRIDILAAAHNAVTTRGERYGEAADNLGLTAALWSDAFGANIDAIDVCNLMMLFKMSRAISGPTEDTYADIAGYAALAGELLSEAATQPTTTPPAEPADVDLRMVPFDDEASAEA